MKSHEMKHTGEHVVRIEAEALRARLVKDKKTIQSRVHFVLPVRIGEVVVKADIPDGPVLRAIERALEDCL